MTASHVLIGCETSGVMRRAFADHGHDVWSCDLLRATTADGAPYLRLRQQGMSDIYAFRCFSTTSCSDCQANTR